MSEPTAGEAREWPPSLLLELVMPGDPMPAPRPKVGQSRGYNPAGYTAYVERLQWMIRSAMTRAKRHGVAFPVKGQVHVVAAFFRSDRRRVDIDNLQKTAFDAMNGLVLEDDSQIREVHAWKDLGNPNPRTVIEVYSA